MKLIKFNYFSFSVERVYRIELDLRIADASKLNIIYLPLSSLELEIYNRSKSNNSAIANE